MKIICISDTHGLHRQLTFPEDLPTDSILIHAGDITSHGELSILQDFNDWMGELPYKHKIAIAGNHDFCFENKPASCKEMITNFTYLEDESVTIENLLIYGSPWQPVFFNWAFNLSRGNELREKWQLIPKDADIIITHGPVHGILDYTNSGLNVGCEELKQVIQSIQPRIHACGHIHEAYGQQTINHTTYINASNCNLKYQMVNPPIIVEIN